MAYDGDHKHESTSVEGSFGNRLAAMGILRDPQPDDARVQQAVTANTAMRELTPQEWLQQRAIRLREEAHLLSELAAALPPKMSWEATIALRNLITRSFEVPIR